MKILITGANGFVGNALSEATLNLGYQVHLTMRSFTMADGHAHSRNARVFAVGDINANTHWQDALTGIDVVIHLAARVHVMHENTQDPLTEFRKVNVDGTLNLARQAVAAGVKRIVFISSVKVNGEFTPYNKPFTVFNTENPQDAYGISKFEAELALRQLAKETGLEVVIIRPPLIYGQGVKANFANMLKLVKLGLPLPFGAIQNKRSLIYVENLLSFIVTCIAHPNSANQTFLVSDGEDVSTTQLLQLCADAMGKYIWLMPIPQRWLTNALNALGKQNLVQRLLGNLQIDNQYACNRLNWQPPFTLTEGLKRSVRTKGIK